MKTCEILAKNLRSRRLSKNLSQQVFAESVGMAYKYYQELEGGRIPTVKLDTIERLAKAHDLNTWELLHPDIFKPAEIKKARPSKIAR